MNLWSVATVICLLSQAGPNTPPSLRQKYDALKAGLAKLDAAIDSKLLKDVYDGILANQEIDGIPPLEVWETMARALKRAERWNDAGNSYLRVAELRKQARDAAPGKIEQRVILQDYLTSGECYEIVHNFPRALHAYQSALDVTDRMKQHSLESIQVLWSLARCSVALAELIKADDYFSQAIRASEQIPLTPQIRSQFAPMKAHLQLEHGMFLLGTNQFFEAEKSLRRARNYYEGAAAEKALPPDQELLSNLVVLHINMLRRLQGIPQAAETEIEEILDNPKSLHINEEIQGLFRIELAYIKLALGKPREAIEQYELIKRLHRDDRGRKLLISSAPTAELRECLINSVIQKKRKVATPYFTGIVDAHLKALQSRFDLLSIGQRLLSIEQARPILDTFLTLAINDDLPDEEIYRRVLNWKGAVYQRAKETLAVLPGQSLRPDSESPFTPETLAKSLPPGVAFVDYYIYRHFQPPKPGSGLFEAESRVLAFVVRRGLPVKMMAVNVPVKQLEAIINAWHAYLPQSTVSGNRPVAELTEYAQWLARLIWLPLKEPIEGADSIVISPDGPLWKFPFAALPGPMNRYLIQDHPLAYAYSGWHVREMYAGGIPAAALPKQSPTLLIGAIEYGERTYSTDLRPLECGENWLVDVAQLFSRSHSDPLLQILRGSQATRDALIHKFDSRYHEVVFFGHGPYAPRPLLAFPFQPTEANRDPLDSQSQEAARQIANQIILPLAQFNSRRNSSTESPYLALTTVFSLNLLGLDVWWNWGCNFTAGPDVSGQGVIGIPWALHLAGCRAVCTSFCNVDAALVDGFSKRVHRLEWEGGLPPGSALRQAQLDCLRNPNLPQSHPRYWASWILIGEKGMSKESATITGKPRDGELGSGKEDTVRPEAASNLKNESMSETTPVADPPKTAIDRTWRPLLLITIGIMLTSLAAVALWRGLIRNAR